MPKKNETPVEAVETTTAEHEARIRQEAASDTAQLLASALTQAVAAASSPRRVDDAKWYRGDEYTFYVKNVSGAAVSLADQMLTQNQPIGHADLYQIPAGGGQDVRDWTQDVNYFTSGRTALRLALEKKHLVRLTPEEWDAEQDWFQEVTEANQTIRDAIIMTNDPTRKAPDIAEIRQEVRLQNVQYPRRSILDALITRIKNSNRITDSEIKARIQKENHRRRLNVYEKDHLISSISERKFPETLKYLHGLKAVEVTEADRAILREKNEKFQRAMNE